MKEFVKNLAALIKVKTVVTFVVIAVFAVLALRGDISPEDVMVIVSTVIAFYFATQHEKHNATTEQVSNHSSSCPFMTGLPLENEPEELTAEIVEQTENLSDDKLDG